MFWHVLIDVYQGDYITKSKFSFSHPNMAQFVEMPFIVFRLAGLISTGQGNYLGKTRSVTVSVWSLICQGIV